MKNKNFFTIRFLIVCVLTRLIRMLEEIPMEKMYKIIIEKIIQLIIISYIGILIHKYGYPFLDPTLIQPAPEPKIPDTKDLVETTREYGSGLKYLLGTGISLSLGFIWNNLWTNFKKGFGNGLDFLVSGFKKAILPIITQIKESLPAGAILDSFSEISQSLNLEERIKNLSFAKDLVEAVTETPMDLVEAVDSTTGGLLKAALISSLTTGLSKIKLVNEKLKNLFFENDRIEIEEIMPLASGGIPLEPPIGPKALFAAGEESFSLLSNEVLIGVGLFLLTLASYLVIRRFTETSVETQVINTKESSEKMLEDFLEI
jgi:hypothetical protein